MFICLSLSRFRGLKSPHYQSHLCDRSSLSSRLPFFSFSCLWHLSLSLSISISLRVVGAKKKVLANGEMGLPSYHCNMHELLLLPSYSFHLTNCRQCLTCMAAHHWTRAPQLCYIFGVLLTFSYLPDAFLHVPWHWLAERHNSHSSLSHKPYSSTLLCNWFKSSSRLECIVYCDVLGKMLF